MLRLRPSCLTSLARVKTNECLILGRRGYAGLQGRHTFERRRLPTLARPSTTLQIQQGCNQIGGGTRRSYACELSHENPENGKYHKEIHNHIMQQRVFADAAILSDVDHEEAPIIPNMPAELSLAEVIESNTFAPLVSGLFIEFFDTIGNQVSFGCVLEPAHSIFAEESNGLSVLTYTNTMVQVKPHDVINHWLGVIEVSRTERSTIVELLRYFLTSVRELHLHIGPQMDIVFSQHCKPHHVSPILLLQIVETLKLPEKSVIDLSKNYWNQCVVIALIQRAVAATPKFIVPSLCRGGLLGKGSHVGKGFSNGIIEGSTNYLVNSGSNVAAFSRVEADVAADNMLGYMEALKYLEELKPDREALNAYFFIYEGGKARHLIEAMKLAIVYPHPVLMRLIGHFFDFGTGSVGAIRAIHDFLVSSKIYDFDTDVLLLANILGRPKLDTVAVCNPSQMAELDLMDSISLRDPQRYMELEDYWPHLRSCRPVYADHVIFALPMGQKAIIAVSLERVNSRKHTIHIHVPDIVTRLPLNSQLFASIFNKIPLTRGVNHEPLDKLGPLIDKLLFSEQNLPVWVSAKNIDSFDAEWERQYGRGVQAPRLELATCLTISFSYNSYDPNPFVDLGTKVSVLFDRIDKATIKMVEWDELEACLSGQLDSPRFTLFKRSPQSSGLGSSESHQLQFIDKVLSTHFKARNREGALCTSPTLNCDIADSLLLEIVRNYDTDASAMVMKSDVAYPKGKFFVSEINKMLSRLVGAFLTDRNIPMVATTQEAMEMGIDASSVTPGFDGALVSHENRLLPQFRATNYYQTLLARDEFGFVLVGAQIIASNWLQPRRHRSYPGINTCEGIAIGYTPIVSPQFLCLWTTQDLMNQIQLLYHCHINQDTQAALTEVAHVNCNANLVANGFSVSGPMLHQMITDYLHGISAAYEAGSVLLVAYKRQWTARHLNHQVLQTTTTPKYYCIITLVGSNTLVGPNAIKHQIYQAFCSNLGIEVTVLIASKTNSRLLVGEAIMCDKVLDMNFPYVIVLGQTSNM